jgi:hypothetical protein
MKKRMPENGKGFSFSGFFRPGRPSGGMLRKRPSGENILYSIVAQEKPGGGRICGRDHLLFGSALWYTGLDPPGEGPGSRDPGRPERQKGKT